jgi:carboxymethylenebutenolidase
MKDRISIKGRDGAFGAYMARPKTLPAPAVVVLQEIFGGNMPECKNCRFCRLRMLHLIPF